MFAGFQIFFSVGIQIFMDHFNQFKTSFYQILIFQRAFFKFIFAFISGFPDGNHNLVYQYFLAKNKV